MTFDQWYFENVGVTVEGAKARGVYSLELMEKCWQDAQASSVIDKAKLERVEPVAVVGSFTNGSYGRNYKMTWVKDVDAGTKLYAHSERDPLTDDMVTAAARVLNKRQAEARDVDEHDNWNFHGNDIKDDARAALEAAHKIMGK